jgi:hypothetical protein
MQLNDKQIAYNKRKGFEKSYTKYRELNVKPIVIKVYKGTIMHRCDITFRDGNKQTLVLHKIGTNIILSQPKMWEYPMEKLAVLDHLTKLTFENTSYTVIESNELWKPSSALRKYKVAGEVNTDESIIYALSTKSFEEKDFNDYDIRCKSTIAKIFKFRGKYVR